MGITGTLFNDTSVRHVVKREGRFSILEYDRDVSVNPLLAENEYFCAKMNYKKKQLVATLDNTCGVVLQAGAMQMMIGAVQMTSNIKGVGDFAKKLIGSKVTGETASKPLYSGAGTVLCEPTYKYLLIEDLKNWGGAITIDDGLFLACEDTAKMKVVARSNLSSAVLGGEGLFNTSLIGSGLVVLESDVPREELMEFTLDNDTIKIDGNMAIAWSNSLKFTVEKAASSLMGSAVSKEGFVNVYSGTGKILVKPLPRRIVRPAVTG